MARILPIHPTLDPTPAAPAAHILHFAPRTEVLGIRMPNELARWVQQEADKRYWTKSHFLLRLICQAALDQESNLRTRCKQEAA